MKNPVSKYKKIDVQAPSNIAFIKYWGKFGRQFPCNPSLSMTLSKCRSITSIEYAWGEGSLDHTETKFENEHSPVFHKRLNLFLKSITDLYPELNELSLKVSSHNTFPHSAGIASSASAYAAIGFALAHIISEKRDENFDISLESSRIARLGSGSAARSIGGPFIRWGEDHVHGGSNEFAQRVQVIHENFNEFNDCILLVDSGEKSVSSSVGHKLMDGHPFRESRITQAQKNFKDLLETLKTGDVDYFGEIVESEALTLHALMMSSNPSYILLKPNSLEIISKVREFRKKTKFPLYFTIDAGPNIHLLYPNSFKAEIEEFINEELRSLCVADCIFDHAGLGAIINE